MLLCVLMLGVGQMWGDEASWKNNTTTPTDYFTLGSNTTATSNSITIGSDSYTHSINMSNSAQSSNKTNGNYIKFTLTSESNISILFKASGGPRTIRINTGWSYAEVTNATQIGNGATPTGGVKGTSESISNGSTGTFSIEKLSSGTYYICASGTVNIFNITITPSTPASSSWYLPGTWNEWSTSSDAVKFTGDPLTLTLHLNEQTSYDFKLCEKGSTEQWYDNNGGKVIASMKDWSIAGTNSGNNSVFFTGPEGDYTFTLNTTNKTLDIAYPDVHPNANYMYFENTDVWGTVGAYIYSDDNWKLTSWEGTPSLANSTVEICNHTYHYCVTPKYSTGGTFNNVIFRNLANIGQSSARSAKKESHGGKWSDNNSANIHDFTTYSITFDGNGSTNGEMTNVTGICPGSSVTLAANAYTKTGYNFAGWATTSSGSKAYNDEAQVTVNSDLPLYAKWTPKTNTKYVVKHFQQKLDGTYPTDPTDTENLTGTTGASVTPAVKSYTGFTAPSTQTKEILAAGSLVVEYQYTRNSYKLTWDNVQGATVTGGTPAGDVKFGAEVTAPTVEKTGYTFNNWNPAVVSPMPANAATYTAQWTAKTHTIYLDANGGSANGSATATYNSSSLTDVSHATNSETYTLVGYYTENDTKVINADGTLVASVPNYTDANGKWIKDNDCTLYAHWQQNLITPTVTWGTSNPTTVYPGGKYTISVSTNSDATLAVGNLTASKATLEDQVVSGSTITAIMKIAAAETNAPSLRFQADATSTYSASDETQNITLGSCSGGGIGEETTYTCGFESADGWSATSISSNSTQLTESPTFSGGKTGKQWTVSVSINTGSASGTKGATVAIANTQVASGSYSLYGSAIGSQNPDYWEMVSDFTFNDISAISYKQYDNDKGKTATKVYYSTDKTNWTQFGGDITSTASQWTDIAVTCTDVSNKKDIYLKIRGENTGTSSGKIVAIDDLSITYKSSSSSTGGEKQTPTMSWSENITYGITKSTTESPFTISASANTIGNITYSLSNVSGTISINSTTGAITASTAGSATVTATVAEVGCYNSASISYDLTVTAPTYSLSIAATPAGYGMVSPTSVANIPSGSAVTTNKNSFTINGTTVTATATNPAIDDGYTYSFKKWNNLPVTVTANVNNVEAEFERSAKEYTVTLNTNDGTINAGNVTGYTYGVGATLPTNVTKDGNDFDGWFDNSSLTGSAVTTIANTATGNKEFWAKWTATTVPVTGVTLDEEEITIAVGNTETLTATIAPKNATNKNVTWSSDKEGVATVEDGVVTAVAAGTATITVTTEDGSKTATCTVIVTGDTPEPTDCNAYVMKWKSSTLYDGSTDASYTYTPASTHSDYLTLSFTQAAGKEAEEDRAMEKENASLNTGKFAGNTFTFTPKSGKITKIRYFGKVSGIAEYSLDGSSWTEYGTKTEAAYTIDLSATPASQFSMRNKGTDGASHSGVWIRNMEITICPNSTPTTRTITLNPNGGSFTSTPSGWTKSGDNLTAQVAEGSTLTLPALSIVSRDGYIVVTDGWYTGITDGTKYTTITYDQAASVSTLHPHWTENPQPTKQYATSVDFAAIAKEVKIDKTSTVAVSSVLNDNHYNISSTSNAEWDYQTSDDTGEKKADRGLKIKATGVTIDFWVLAGKKVTMTFGTLAGTASGKISISTNGCSDSDYQDFTGAATASYGDPVSKIVETTEETHFCIKTKSSSWNIIKAITIEDATPTCTTPDLAYTTTSIEKQVGDATFTNALTNTYNVAVTYTSSDGSVATVANDGTITLGTKVGSTTIKATSVAQTISEVDYCADEVSYTITVAAAPATTYTITIIPYGGTISESGWTLSDGDKYIKSGIPSGTEVTLPTLTKSGCEFVKWTNNIGGEPVESTATVTGNLTLHANWHETCQGGGSGGEYATATMTGLSEATYTGCSVEINNTNAIHTIGTDCYVTFKGTLQSSKNYVKLTLNNERTFAAGDVVTIVYSQTQNVDNNQICVGSDDGDDQYEHPFEVAAQNTSKTGTYTIIEDDGICGTSIIKVGRYGGSNGSFHSISISSGSSSGGGTCHYVTYHANAEDATGCTADENAYNKDKTTATIVACGYTREGYNFVGWATSSEGAVVYTADATYTFTFDEDEDDLDLYAVWAPKVVEVNDGDIVSLTAPVDVLIIHQGGQVTGDVTVNERIEYIRPTVGTYSNINQWYTFSVPFTPTAVTIYDETDKEAYSIGAVYGTDADNLQAGYYYLKTLSAQTVAKDVVANWKYITTAMPEKDKPYIIYFSNEHGFGNYFKTNTQVSFIAEVDKEPIIINNTATPQASENIDGFQLVANPTLHNIEVENVYKLNPATNQFELEENAIIPPFECYIQATKSFTAANAIIRFIPEGSFIYTDWKGAGAAQSDKPCKFIENERLIIRYHGQLYDGTGAMLNHVK